MIKNIAYFPLQCALNSSPVLDAVLDAFQCSGIQTQENSWTSDAVVIWSVLWHGKMATNQQVYEHYRQQGKPVVVLDVGTLYRGQTWKVAVNNITSDGYYGHHTNLDTDRPRKLGISLAISMSASSTILIAAQHSKSLQVENMGGIERWINDQVKLIRAVTDRPITIRPHPRSRLDLSKLPKGVTVQNPERIVNTYDNFDLRFDYYALVNYNSGPGIQSAIAGVRPIVHNSSLAYPVSVNYADIEKPYNIDRYQWLAEICHTEYTLDELRMGLWLNRIAPALEQSTVPA